MQTRSGESLGSVPGGLIALVVLGEARVLDVLKELGGALQESRGTAVDVLAHVGSRALIGRIARARAPRLDALFGRQIRERDGKEREIAIVEQERVALLDGLAQRSLELELGLHVACFGFAEARIGII